MDPRLVRLFEQGRKDDEVAAVLRLNAEWPLPAGVRVVSRFGNIATVRLRRGEIPSIHDSKAVASMKPAVSLLRETRVSAAPAAATDRDARRPSRLRETGTGVLFGLVDFGFDFAHPDFRNADGTTRLRSLWDQSAPVGSASPAPYGYGAIHSPGEINAALAAPNPYAALNYDPADSDADGQGAHGTHVAGIAVGNGRSGGPSGIAPSADIVFVQLTTLDTRDPDLADSVSVLEAIDFIRTIAGSQYWVVNLSMGQCGDPHDGTTLIEQGLDAVLAEAPGRAIAQSAGNYFSSRQHSSGRLANGERRTLTWRVPSGEATNELEVWYSGGDAFTVSLRGPDGEPAGRAGLREHAPLRAGGRICGAIHNRKRDPNNLDNNIVLWLDPTAPAGDWKLTLAGSSVTEGAYHVWVQRGGDDGGQQAAFRPGDANPFFTTNSICNGRRTVVVGAYDPRSARHDAASFSSAGPTRDGRSKPDLLAPGVGILSARSMPTGAPSGRELQVRMTGTSMAAPHAAGTIALMFEAAPRPLSIEETRLLLLAGARPADRAGRESIRYGYGYLDTDAAVRAARALGGTLGPTSQGASEMTASPATASASLASRGKGSGPLSTADTLIGLGGVYAGSPSALLVRILTSFADPSSVDPAASAGLLDPATMFDVITSAQLTHLRPLLTPLFVVVGRPRQPLAGPLQPGDVMVRRALGEPGMGYASFIAGHDVYPRDEAARRGLAPESARHGYYAPVVEAGPRPRRLSHRFARRIMNPEGRVPADTLIVRPLLRRRPLRLAEDVDFDTAIPANRQYAAQLGWGARYNDIVALLGLSGTPTEQDFAQAVANWQAQNNLASDGMLGPDTWSAMQAQLSPAPNPAPGPAPAPSPAIDVNRAVQANRQYAVQLGWTARYGDIVALLRLSGIPTEQDFARAVANWQSQHSLSVDGILGPDTWTAMQPFLGSPVPPVPPVPDSPFAPLVIVKFLDNVQLNVGQGQTLAVNDIVGLTGSANTAAIQSINSGFSGVTFKRACDSLSPAEVQNLVNRASAQDQTYSPPNFNNFLEIVLAQGADPGGLVDALNAWSDVVEYAYVAGIPSDPLVAGVTNPLFTQQGYLAPAPLGVSVQAAWAKGADGSGTAFIDVEQGWFLGHQDLPVGIPLLLGTNRTNSFAHGAAVLSEIVAIDDTFGMVGAAPNARARLVSYFRPGLDPTKNSTAEVFDAIMAASSGLFFGNVMLLEIQFTGDVGTVRGTNVPVETDPHIFEAIRLATKVGVIVIEAAGNGSANLDFFVGGKGVDKGKSILSRTASADFKDSGAIMVGGGTAAFPHQRFAGSNFGSRIDCYAWAENIIACGFNPNQANVFFGVPGQTVFVEGQPRQPGFAFGGTSGASPIVVGCCLLVQHLQTLLTPKSGVKGSLGPTKMRRILSDPQNGTPSFLTTDLIGSMPDLQKIIANEYV